MFIQTESTPNPATLKFLPGRDVLGRGGRDFADASAAEASPLARALMGVNGVTRVYLGADFLTLTKAEGVDWAHIKPHALAAIMDHFTSGAPVLLNDATARNAPQAYEGKAAEIVRELVEIIDQRVRPAVARDGGDIIFHSWDHDAGIVFLEMHGACAGCPSSTVTLKNGIENMLKHYVPEVNAVEQVA